MPKEIADKIETSEEALEASQPFIGLWNNLISTTNWDKGDIICKWRAELRDKGEPNSAWSDEAWSQFVGGVTPQHVGRLRRTFERFGHSYQDYKGLFWSHFYAALDWEDAEMWLEGGAQNTWSVSQMRRQRWETLGKVPEDEPKEKDVVAVELDEETQSLALNERVQKGDREVPEGPRFDGPDFGDDESPSSKSKGRNSEGSGEDGDVMSMTSENAANIRPFESFQDLPKDISDAADSFKVAIVKHRASEWEEIEQTEVISLLDALKQLAAV